jgi:hypothetical protein
VWVVVHLYVGLAIGVLVPWPYWALVVLAVGSHVLMDLIPHWDYTRSRRRVLWGLCDFSAGLVTLIVGYLAFHLPLGALALGVIAAAPDFDVLFNAMRGRAGDYWFPSHWQRFPHGQCSPLPGVAVQAVVVAGCCLGMALA